jgi:hypothetical protein
VTHPRQPQSPPAGPEEDAALIADAYLDGLLASAAGAGRSEGPERALDPDLAEVADALASGLVRFHPSFRFEERLALRLRRVARGEEEVPARGLPDLGRVVPDLARVVPEIGVALPGVGREVGRAVDRVERMPVPVLVGGAIASGVSLAGAAIVAWRLSRRPLVRLP